MTCVAVTRGGYGDLWIAESKAEADRHPLIQYGDALVGGPEDVLKQYNRLDLPYMMRKLGRDDLAETLNPDHCFQAMLDAASEILEDPVLIMEQVRFDRDHHSEEYRKMENANKAAGAETKPAEKKDDKPKIKMVAGYPETAKITAFGKDKEDKPYGKDNNPKRAGSKAAAHFAQYVLGKTIKETIESTDITAADIENDARKKGFIVITA